MIKYFLCLLLFLSSFYFSACSSKKSILMDKIIHNETQPEVSPVPNLPYLANFEIYTNGTKRIFTQAMYHQQSAEVYIQADDPTLIHVTASNITWDDFFKTLPFSITKECLVTGTKQSFCTSSTHRLVFMLNGEEVAEALDYKINKDDSLLIKYEEQK